MNLNLLCFSLFKEPFDEKGARFIFRSDAEGPRGPEGEKVKMTPEQETRLAEREDGRALEGDIAGILEEPDTPIQTVEAQTETPESAETETTSPEVKEGGVSEDTEGENAEMDKEEVKKDAFENFKKVAWEKIKHLGKFAKGMMEATVDWFKENWEMASALIATPIATAMAVVKGIKDMAINFIKSPIATLKSAGVGGWQAVKKAASGLYHAGRFVATALLEFGGGIASMGRKIFKAGFKKGLKKGATPDKKPDAPSTQPKAQTETVKKAKTETEIADEMIQKAMKPKSGYRMEDAVNALRAKGIPEDVIQRRVDAYEASVKPKPKPKPAPTSSVASKPKATVTELRPRKKPVEVKKAVSDIPDQDAAVTQILKMEDLLRKGKTDEIRENLRNRLGENYTPDQMETLMEMARARRSTELAKKKPVGTPEGDVVKLSDRVPDKDIQDELATLGTPDVVNDFFANFKFSRSLAESRGKYQKYREDANPDVRARAMDEAQFAAFLKEHPGDITIIGREVNNGQTRLYTAMRMGLDPEQIPVNYNGRITNLKEAMQSAQRSADVEVRATGTHGGATFSRPSSGSATSRRPSVDPDELNKNLNLPEPSDKIPLAKAKKLRGEAAEGILGPLSDAKKEAIWKAHEIKATGGIDAKGFPKYTQAELLAKGRILREAGFNQADRELLLRNGICGAKPRKRAPDVSKDEIPDTRSVYRLEGVKTRDAWHVLEGERDMIQAVNLREFMARGDDVASEMLATRGNKWLDARLRNLGNGVDYIRNLRLNPDVPESELLNSNYIREQLLRSIGTLAGRVENSGFPMSRGNQELLGELYDNLILLKNGE